MNVQLECLGKIIQGKQTGRYIMISRDELADGFFLNIYAWRDSRSEPLLAEWFPSLEAIHYFARDRDWQVDWPA